MVPASQGHEVLVGAFFRNLAPIKNYDLVGMGQGGQAVGRNNGGFSLTDLTEVSDDGLFGHLVYRRQGVVQD